ncbi:MAG: 30S ribosomal protein S12 methylthiotransferase RimO [Prevotella sp.]|nr:30S ribosomal protein S12 methylthiotransferase RimO [Prevotella sp.]HBA68779.1 30S ribosomal protein S12 methylthiotransferase RimO [Lachnospiraceae bacterium]
MKLPRVNIISLGCSKNLIDTERLMKMLSDTGINVVFESEKPEKNDIVVINTCGFIGDSKEESINTILQWVQQKEQNHIRAVYVMGCLSERYRDILPKEIEGVDGWFGKTDWPGIVKCVSGLSPAVSKYDRIITTPKHHAYLKISEGCNRFCAFCAIPLITGRHQSRTIEAIADEVKSLCARGVKEFNVIAQDLSSYGLDIYGEKKLAQLVDTIAGIDGVEWIRLHYAYPSDFPLDVLDVMARRKNVCKYLDIALQHISDNVLGNMRRHISSAQTRDLLAEIRKRVPGIHIRTTLMVGFPGEGEDEFQELLDFVREQRFERMGAFAYCEEEDTFAAKQFKDEIPESTRQKRLDQLMALQEEISSEINESKIGKVFRVIIDREEPDFYVGRTEFDSPEVDPEVLIEKKRPLKRGEFTEVRIVQSLPYELIGVPL